MTQTRVVAEFKFRAEAEAAQGFLEAAGIMSIILSDDAGGMRPELLFASPVRLLVLEEDLPRAIELLEAEEYL